MSNLKFVLKKFHIDHTVGGQMRAGAIRAPGTGGIKKAPAKSKGKANAEEVSDEEGRLYLNHLKKINQVKRYHNHFLLLINRCISRTRKISAYKSTNESNNCSKDHRSCETACW